jgi:hypothetical protein
MNLISYLRFALIAFVSAILIVSCQSSPPPTTSSNTPDKPAATEQISDEEYMSALGLMKGHLIVAKELLDAKKPEQAEPHIGHPVEEIYGDIESDLARRNVPEFKGTLNQLHDLVKTAPNSPEIPANYQTAIDAVDRAIAALPQEQVQSPEFGLKVIDRVLGTAKGEYQAAIANNKIAEAIEYQDSRGFVLYTNSLYQKISEPLKQKNPQTYKDISSSLEELLKAWPAPIPPEQPVMTTEKVSELVEKIKNTSEKFYSMNN